MKPSRSIGEPSGTKSPETPEFFKIILQDTLRTNKLLLPEKFKVLHGGKLSDTITLEFPCGSEWKIGLERRDNNGGISLLNGWGDIMRHYSIELGHLLVFAYEGNSKFRVSVFDRTTCKIEYRKGQCPRVEPEKKNQKEKSSAPHFEVKIGKTYARGTRLSVPVKFAQQHLQENCDVILNSSNGGSWKMQYSNGVYTGRELYASPKFHSGWKKFAQENQLDIGDSCTFTMSKDHGEVSFDVAILRVNDRN